MKQIEECLDRCFQGKPPLKKKWQARITKHNCLILYHYHHLILNYDLENNRIIESWWEKPADKRGLDAAKAYLERKLKQMGDFATFLKDVKEGDAVKFRKGQKYEVLGEDQNFYYIQLRKGTNQVAQFPKSAENEAFIF